MNRSRLEEIVSAQIESIEQPELVACLERRLVPPRLEHRGWDYGEDGQTYPCWICVEDRATNTAIAFCEEGFGPTDPWGLLFIEGEHTSMGMDSSWFPSLEEAVRDSMFWDGGNPPGYEAG